MRRDDHRPEGEFDDAARLSCDAALALVPGYLDEELSEEQAAPLRRHLLACHACREHAQAERALHRWFVPSEPVAVPEGFAARMTQLAFSGATVATPASRPVPLAVVESTAPRDLQRFVLRSVAVAAAVLLAFALALHWRNRPAGEELYADDLPAMWSEPAVQRPVQRPAPERRGGATIAPNPKSSAAPRGAQAPQGETPPNSAGAVAPGDSASAGR